MRTQSITADVTARNAPITLWWGMVALMLFSVADTTLGAPMATIRVVVRVPAGDVTDAELKKVTANPNVVALDLSGCKFTSRGFAQLATLKALEELNLAESSLTSGDMEVIKDLQNLRVLNLAKTEVDDAGLNVIAHRKLESLDISFTRATKASLASLNRLTSLKKLAIKGTAIGLTNLVVLKRLGEIEVAYLEGQFTFQEESLLRIMQADAKRAPKEVDRLSGVCKTGTSDERVRAIMRLCDLTLYDERAEQIILGVASNDGERDQKVRRWATYHLSYVALHLALPVLRKRLTDSNNDVATSAVYALSAFTHDEEDRAVSSEVLIKDALMSKNVSVRKEAYLSIVTSAPTPQNRRLVEKVLRDPMQPEEVTSFSKEILESWDEMEERERKSREAKQRKSK